MEAGATGVGVLGKGAVMLCFIIRNMYLVYLPVPGRAPKTFGIS